MSKATTKEVRALLEMASEMFNETGCVPGAVFVLMTNRSLVGNSTGKSVG